MEVGVREPDALLKPWIECYWNVKFSAGPEPRQETILPNGKIEMIFALQGNYSIIAGNTRRMRYAWLSGLHHEPLRIEYGGSSNLIGIRFYPHGIFPFMGIPVQETVNHVEHLVDLWGTLQEEIYERLCTYGNNGDRFRFLDEILIRKINDSRTSQYRSVAYAIEQMKSRPGRSLPDLASELGFTQRHFNRVFKDQTGMNPKLLCQIYRFEQAFSCLFEHPTEEAANYIMALGYYDQPHFIREFKRFSGMTPSEYKRRAVQSSNFLLN